MSINQRINDINSHISKFLRIRQVLSEEVNPKNHLRKTLAKLKWTANRELQIITDLLSGC